MPAPAGRESVREGPLLTTVLPPAWNFCQLLVLARYARTQPCIALRDTKKLSRNPLSAKLVGSRGQPAKLDPCRAEARRSASEHPSRPSLSIPDQKLTGSSFKPHPVGSM